MKAILTLAAASLAAAALAGPGSASPDPFVPFVTDFPAGDRTTAPKVASDGFDGLDAALGAAAGLALGALAAASVPAARRRRSLSSA